MNCDRHDLPIISSIGCEECEIDFERAELKARQALDDQPYHTRAVDAPRVVTGRWTGRLLNTEEVAREDQD